MSNIKINIKRELNGTDPFEDGKFDNKMTHEQRCFALCLFIKGEPWRRIAAYYSVHYRTVQMISTGPRYKAIRSEFQQLGQESFVAKYYGEVQISEYNKWKKDNTVDASSERQNTNPDAPGWSPNKGAGANKGQHERKSTIDGSAVFFEILWRDGNDGVKPGWYISHNTGVNGPFGTSTMALDGARILWDIAPVPVEAAPTTEEEIKAEQLFEAAKTARAEMEANPSEATVIAFIEAAFAVYAFVDNSEGLPDPSAAEMFARIDWRGFDWTSYYKKLY